MSGMPVSASQVLGITGMANLAVLAWLALSGWMLRRKLGRIPVRIHVAGTRGKSTTTRLIAAAFTANGRTVVGKTTGSEPRLLLPDGSERRIRRLGRPSVREQGALISFAEQQGADTVVAECMAIQPEMLWASEALFVRATTLVVTNVRSDHLEEFGDDPAAIADSFRWLVPVEGHVVVAREVATDAFRRHVTDSRSRLTVVDTTGLDPVDANRALALAVCSLHGLDSGVAAGVMSKATPDPGHYVEVPLTVQGKPVRFANAFACNDVESFAQLWARRTCSARPVVVFNARSDRPLRTRDFLRFLSQQDPLPILFVAGDRLGCVLARRAGFDAGSVRPLRSRGRRALRDIAEVTPSGGMIWGVGNYQGFGAQLSLATVEADGSC
jgi:poly-gamma-glutamate synthase PgsB/CapB